MKNYETATNLTLRNDPDAPKGDAPDVLPMNTIEEVDAALERLNTLREDAEAAARRYLRATKVLSGEIEKVSKERGREWLLSAEGRSYFDLRAQLEFTTFTLPKAPVRIQ